MLKKILTTTALLLGAVMLLPLVIMWLDYMQTRDAARIRPAGAAVVLATKAYENGRPNPCLTARVAAGAALYRAGKVKKLVMSGGINRDRQYGSRNMQRIAEEMGVPPEAIVQEDRSSTTFENIVFSRRLIEDTQNVVVVSAGFHLPRAKMMAEKQWDQNVQTFAAPFCSEPHGGYAYSLLREAGALLKNGLMGHY